MTQDNTPIHERNPVRQATLDFGGQHRFALLLQLFGIQVHRQTVYNWATSGFIPNQYRRGIELIIKKYGKTMTNPKGLLDCVRKDGGFRGAAEFPNEPLEQWFIDQGGISKFVKMVNEKIKKQNDALPNEDSKVPKFTYVMIHNWLKRGRVSENFQSMMHILFDCPKEIMDNRKKPTAQDILG